MIGDEYKTNCVGFHIEALDPRDRPTLLRSVWARGSTHPQGFAVHLGRGLSPWYTIAWWWATTPEPVCQGLIILASPDHSSWV